MKIVTLIVAIIGSMLIYGCSNPVCKDSKKHSWGNWTQNWEKPNTFGYLQQSHTCTNCGFVELITR